MRRVRIHWLIPALACLTLGGIAVTAIAKRSSKPPTKKLLIKGCQSKKSPVTFDHPMHVSKLEPKGNNCEICHHKVDNKPSTEDRCSGCHKKPQGKLGTCQDKSLKKNPFHVRCLGCHKERKKKDANFKGPTKCKKCHPK